ncbi:MAG TPA: carboxypeptidase-like regulatory domain-containing protein [Candidatus Nitrosotalea sp.]|nr:carboxypeptidase-like regulatory domain-containing protein [Candidatus Nitrosotalea sp.]
MANFISLRRPLMLIGLLVVFAGQSSLALAGTSGNIAGTVRDSATGAPIAGVSLRISSNSQTISTTTDSRGHFVVFSLQPDDYTLTAQKDGYGTQSFSGYSVSADQTQLYDLKLAPAAPGS